MGLQGPGRIVKGQSKQVLIYVGKEVGKDSAWPFEPGDKLWIEIDEEERSVTIRLRPPWKDGEAVKRSEKKRKKGREAA